MSKTVSLRQPNFIACCRCPSTCWRRPQRLAWGPSVTSSAHSRGGLQPSVWPSGLLLREGTPLLALPVSPPVLRYSCFLSDLAADIAAGLQQCGPQRLSQTEGQLHLAMHSHPCCKQGWLDSFVFKRVQVMVKCLESALLAQLLLCL